MIMKTSLVVFLINTTVMRDVLCDCLKLELYRLVLMELNCRLDEVAKSKQKWQAKNARFKVLLQLFLVTFFQFPLQFVFWVVVYTKNRQLGLAIVVPEQIVNSGCALVDYQLIDNSSSSNC